MLTPDDSDRQALATVRGMAQIFAEEEGAAAGPRFEAPALGDVVQLAQELRPLLPELLPGVAKTGELFLRELAQRATQRASQRGGDAGL